MLTQHPRNPLSSQPFLLFSLSLPAIPLPRYRHNALFCHPIPPIDIIQTPSTLRHNDWPQEKAGRGGACLPTKWLRRGGRVRELPVVANPSNTNSLHLRTLAIPVGTASCDISACAFIRKLAPSSSFSISPCSCTFRSCRHQNSAFWTLTGLLGRRPHTHNANSGHPPVM